MYKELNFINYIIIKLSFNIKYRGFDTKEIEIKTQVYMYVIDASNKIHTNMNLAPYHCNYIRRQTLSS